MDNIETVCKFLDRDSWHEQLQEAPKENWLKTRDLGNKKTKYLPINFQQALADLMFREFVVFEEKYQVVVNEILCTVRISFLPDYPDAEHGIMSGTGAKPIQQRKGSSASLFPDGKLPNSLEYNAPAARSAAISNALNTFGNIFGRNVGRDTTPDFSYTRKDQKKKIEKDGDTTK